MITSLMISAQQCRPEVPPTSAHQCLSVSPSSATHHAAYQCPSLLHINTASSMPPDQCPRVLPHQCNLSVPIHATSSVPISTAYQCLVLPISAAY
ncbi:unnamed protein product, partial [Staurois parvus]